MFRKKKGLTLIKTSQRKKMINLLEIMSIAYVEIKIEIDECEVSIFIVESWNVLKILKVNREVSDLEFLKEI